MTERCVEDDERNDAGRRSSSGRLQPLVWTAALLCVVLVASGTIRANWLRPEQLVLGVAMSLIFLFNVTLALHVGRVYASTRRTRSKDREC